MRAVWTHWADSDASGIQATPSEGWHSLHSETHRPLLSSLGRATISDDDERGGAAAGWTSLLLPPGAHDSLGSTAGRMCLISVYANGQSGDQRPHPKEVD